MSQLENAAETATGFFGKLPCASDFIRYAASSDAAQIFQHWLQAGTETLISAGRLPAAMRFLFTPDKAPTFLVGVISPSQDHVGREFPFALFKECAGRPQENLAGRILAHQALLDAMQGALQESAQLDGNALLERVRNLMAAPSAPTVSPMVEHAETISQWFTRLFAQKPPGQQFYALQVLLMARDVRRWQREPGQHLSLLFPLSQPCDLTQWISLVEEAMRGVCPIAGCFWTEQWLTVSLAEPSVPALVALNDPQANLGRVWPCWTDRPTATEQAAASLPPAVHAVLLDSTSTLGALLESMKPEPAKPASRLSRVRDLLK